MRKTMLVACLGLAACAAPPPAPPETPPPEAPPAVAPVPPATPSAGSHEHPSNPESGAYPEPEALRTLFGEEYDRALAAIGLDRAGARPTLADMSLSAVGRFRTPLFDALLADPTLSDRYARTYREMAFQNARTLEGSSMFAAARLGVGVRIALLGDPLAEEAKEAEKPGALVGVVRAFRFSTPSRPADKGIPPADAVPPRVQAAAALILRAWERAQRQPGTAPPRQLMDPGGLLAEAADATIVLAKEGDDDRLRAAFESGAERADLRRLARAAAEVGLAADRACEWLRGEPPSAPFEWRAETMYGTVLLRGGGDDADTEADAGPFLLRIDTGGNDHYGAGAAASRDAACSVLIDVAGDDTYESRQDAPAFGSGFCGVGLLADLAGNDHYVLKGPRSLGLGAGVFGVGALLDCGGDDVYEGHGFCEGAGAVGWGTLADLGGKDTYHAFEYSQGFGFVLGAGVLTDLSGDDEYVLEDRDIQHPSAQSKEHNDSLGQGFGFGVRADYLDGHSLAGGVGILADREGSDRYSCGVFGQGAGYWMGVGMLLDGAGDDAYGGVWYVQGACAHFAVGILEDAGGDDRYVATMNMAQGAGHDYSVGVLLDRAGNDDHTAPNLSLGGGNDDGAGFFIDAGGDDTYRSRGTTLGLGSMVIAPESPTVRHGSLTLGVFLDLGGKDTYLDDKGAPQPFAGDGRLWRQAERVEKPPFSNLRGVGVDR
jgi:hypothetical protein